MSLNVYKANNFFLSFSKTVAKKWLLAYKLVSSLNFKTNHKINQLISAIDKQTPEAFCQRAPIAK